QYHFHPMNDVLFETQSQIIRELGQKEDCIIVGRCANYVLGDKCFSLFVYAPFEYRVQSIMERLGREEKSARALVKKMDKTRRSYYEFFTDEKWKDLSNYQMCIDTSRFDQEFLLKLLADVYAALYLSHKETRRNAEENTLSLSPSGGFLYLLQAGFDLFDHFFIFCLAEIFLIRIHLE